MRGESRLYIGGINGSILAWRQGAKGLADKSNRLFGPDVPIYLHLNGTAFQERFPGCTEGLGRQCGAFRAIERAPAHIAYAQQLPHTPRHTAYGRAVKADMGSTPPTFPPVHWRLNSPRQG